MLQIKIKKESCIHATSCYWVEKDDFLNLDN